MNSLVVQIVDVGNADCLLIRMPHGSRVGSNIEVNVVDFYDRASKKSSQLLQESSMPPEAIFVCLTHPHCDHMTGMAKALNLLSVRKAEFWHTIADVPEVVRLWSRPSVLDASITRKLSKALEQLADLIDVVADKVPPERIRFIHAEPGAPVRMLASAGVTVDVLGPSYEDTVNYIEMLRRVENSRLREIDENVVNRMSAILRITYGENTILIGGDAQRENWLRIIGRDRNGGSELLKAQAVKASHHGAKNSFYDGMWDDLFGEEAGTVFVSAEGSFRPSVEFLESFKPRFKRGVKDGVYCTGPIKRHRRPEFLGLEYQYELDFVSRPEPEGDAQQVSFGTITATIPPSGPIAVNQPFMSVS